MYLKLIELKILFKDGNCHECGEDRDYKGGKDMKSERYFEILEELDDVLSFLGCMVDEYGNPIGLKMKQDDNLFYEGVHHDYVYFCFTKILRSCCAYSELAKKGFREDCMAIGRTIYETYLHVSNALKKPEFIDVTVFQTLKLKVGLAKFVRKNKRVDRTKVFDFEKKKELSHDLRTTKLVNSTLTSVDKKIHKMLYEFMSELIHSNFISSGNYRSRDNKKYNVDNNSPHLDVIFFLTYFLYLTAEHIDYYHYKYSHFYETDLTIPARLELSKTIRRLQVLIEDMSNVIETSENFENIRKIINERVTITII